MRPGRFHFATFQTARTVLLFLCRHDWLWARRAAHCLRMVEPAVQVPTFFAICMLGWDTGTLEAQDPPKTHAMQDVTEIELEDLLKVKVTSPAKKLQTATEVPAALYVIRGEDLERIGATSLAESLRPVPGMNVARVRSSTWAASARGFNDASANKLLVLIDGRSVYSPLHSGVFWDVQDAFLDDVDRIEVIRGPGGTLWGANAVNGVVNVITKRSEDTQGWIVTEGGGSEERAFVRIRTGFKASEDVTVRVYAKWFERDDALNGVDPDRAAYDGWTMARGGFRADWKAGDQDRITFLADYYDGQVKENIFEPSIAVPSGFTTYHDRTGLRGGNFQVRWEREFDPASSLTLQAYYDHTFRTHAFFTDILHTADVDFQHRFRMFGGHDVIWGLGYRLYYSSLDGTFVFQVAPERHTDHLTTAFVQDEITLIEERLRVIVGSKFEHNDYSGFEFQPSARAVWTPHENHTVWTSASRAVRTPTIFDFDGRLNIAVIPLAPPLVGSLLGSEDFKSEELLAYEAGYRVRPLEVLSLDVAAFYNRYDQLRSFVLGSIFSETDPPPTHNVLPATVANDLEGKTWGVEVSANLQLASWWLLQANYTFLRMNLDPGSGEGSSPRHQVWVRSAMDLPGNLSLDLMGRYVGKLEAFDLDNYVEADVRLAWRDPRGVLEAALVGQSLVHDSHAEFQTPAQRSEFQRSVYVSVSLRF